MIIINKKRIQIVVACILIALFAFSFQIANDKVKLNTNNGGLNQNDNAVQTTATPVSGKTIVVDAGHGVPDEGAQSSNRDHRSTNKFKNCIKTTKFIRSKWKHSYFNSFRRECNL